jgi:hypothetical protein
VHLVGRKKLNHRGAVATVVGLPLAILLVWGAQAKAGDTVNVNSSNQKGGITAHTVNITPQPGIPQPGPMIGNQSRFDPETLAILLKKQKYILQDLQALNEKCKTYGPEHRDVCRSARNQFETQTMEFNKFCKDNQVPRGTDGCP